MKALLRILGGVLILVALWLLVTSTGTTCDPVYQDSIKSSCMNHQGNLLFGGLAFLAGIGLIIAGSVGGKKDKSEPSVFVPPRPDDNPPASTPSWPW